MRLILDTSAGTAILADDAGNSRRYLRADQGVIRSSICHATWDEVQGCAVRTKLLETEPFPDPLFIRHRTPGRFPRTTAGDGAWSRVFRYEPEPPATETGDTA